MNPLSAPTDSRFFNSFTRISSTSQLRLTSSLIGWCVHFIPLGFCCTALAYCFFKLIHLLKLPTSVGERMSFYHILIKNIFFLNNWGCWFFLCHKYTTFSITIYIFNLFKVFIIRVSLPIFFK